MAVDVGVWLTGEEGAPVWGRGSERAVGGE